MPVARSRLLPRSFFARPADLVAPDLLNAVLSSGGRTARIVEVEAYRGDDDAASHAHRGPTPRSAIMFGPPGHLYVYLSYGVHWCANVVAHGPGQAGAVLIRAVEPLAGVEDMWERRPTARRASDLGSGPGKVCQALGISLEHNGTDLTRATSTVQLRSDGTAPPTDPQVGPRIGISRAAELPWRFSVPGNPHRSRPW